MATDPRNALPEPPDDPRPRPPFYDPSGDEPAGSSDGLPERSAGAPPHTHVEAKHDDTSPPGHLGDDRPRD